MNIKTSEFALGPGLKQTDSLFPYAENHYECQKFIKELKKEQFDCVSVAAIGRGLDCKLQIDDLPRFESLKNEIDTLQSRVDNIDKMLLDLDAILGRVGDEISFIPTVDGLRSAKCIVERYAPLINKP